MAKKKKQTRKRKVQEQPREKSAFWALSGAILMVVIALFVLLGGFGTGGPLPVGMFSVCHNLFGIGAYLVPVALIFFAVHKFRSEDHQIPLGKLLSMLALLVFSASWLHVAFVGRDELTLGYTGG